MIGSLIDRLFVVAGAFIGSQLPSFIQQYTQRLSGHVEELSRMVNTLRQAAAQSDKTLEQYIAKFISSSDPDFSKQGEFMQSMVVRWQELSISLRQLNETTLWNKSLVFFKGWSSDIVKATFASFQPSLSLTVEGFAYTAIGFFIGYLAYRALKKVITTCWRCVRPVRSVTKSPQNH